MLDVSGLNIDELKALRAKIDAVLDGPADDNASLDDLVTKLRGVREKVAEVGKAAVNKVIKAFFDAHPEVESIRWKQYTPYFNDGDACVFGVREPEARLTGDDQDYADAWSHGYYAEKAGNPKPEALMKGLRVLESAFDEAEDAMKAIFGDHVKVTIGRDLKAEIEEYDHD